MSKTIVHKVLFKKTKAKDLYNLYLDSKKHSKATGAPAKMSKKKGGKYSAHDGYITGENLQLVKDKLIVQTWRAQTWPPEEPDSVFSIYLEPKGKDVVLHAIHATVPDKDAEGIDKGWFHHYWGPWKQYLKGKPIAKSPEM